jgi:hypothetical protein
MHLLQVIIRHRGHLAAVKHWGMGKDQQAVGHLHFLLPDPGAGGHHAHEAPHIDGQGLKVLFRLPVGLLLGDPAGEGAIAAGGPQVQEHLFP